MRKYRGKPWIDYDIYMLSDKWNKKRLEQIKKYPKCFCCGKNKRLTVHHKTYINFGHERMKDLVTLCWHCHKKVHNLIKTNNKATLNNAHKIYKKLKNLGKL